MHLWANSYNQQKVTSSNKGILPSGNSASDSYGSHGPFSLMIYSPVIKHSKRKSPIYRYCPSLKPTTSNRLVNQVITMDGTLQNGRFMPLPLCRLCHFLLSRYLISFSILVRTPWNLPFWDSCHSSQSVLVTDDVVTMNNYWDLFDTSALRLLFPFLVMWNPLVMWWPLGRVVVLVSLIQLLR